MCKENKKNKNKNTSESTNNSEQKSSSYNVLCSIIKCIACFLLVATIMGLIACALSHTVTTLLNLSNKLKEQNLSVEDMGINFIGCCICLAIIAAVAIICLAFIACHVIKYCRCCKKEGSDNDTLLEIYRKVFRTNNEYGNDKQTDVNNGSASLSARG